MSYLIHDDGLRIPNTLWLQIEDCLDPTASPKHPLGCHRPRIKDRVAMDAVLLVLRTGCHWNALTFVDLCSSSTAHRRFTEWMDAGVFERISERGLLAHEIFRGIDWAHLTAIRRKGVRQ
jgi:transposase